MLVCISCINDDINAYVSHLKLMCVYIVDLRSDFYLKEICYFYLCQLQNTFLIFNIYLLFIPFLTFMRISCCMLRYMVAVGIRKYKE